MTRLSLSASAALLAAATLPGVSVAQSTPSVPAAVLPPVLASAPPPVGYVRLPANTPVHLQIGAALSSKTSKIDDMFPIMLLSPIVIDGKTIVPAGTVGQGQVVHAAKARAMGKAGELILAARYLACGDTRIVLRSMHLGGAGTDETLKVVALTAAMGVPFMFISGGEMIVPVGTSADARLMSATDIRVDPMPMCGAPSPSPGPPLLATIAPAATSPATAVPASVQ